MTQDRQTLFICSRLEDEHVERLARFDPSRLAVIYHGDLMPPAAYRGYHKSGPEPRREAAVSRWRAGLAEADILFDLPSAADLPFAGRVKWLQTSSTGVGLAIKRLGLAETDLVVTTARGVHARPLAEFAFMALLAHFRGLDHLRAEQAAKRWTRYCAEEVAGRTLVILGAGDLARGCARLAAAFDMHTIAVTRNPAKTREHGALFDEVVPVSAMHEALQRADAVVLTLPHTPETETIFDRAAFMALRPGAAFVNIGRGQLVDEDVLIEQLRNGRIAFAAIDVARIEPLLQESPLWTLPNVLISPHSASTVPLENGRIVDILAANLVAWLDGRPGDLRNVLDKAALY